MWKPPAIHQTQMDPDVERMLVLEEEDVLEPWGP